MCDLNCCGTEDGLRDLEAFRDMTLNIVISGSDDATLRNFVTLTSNGVFPRSDDAS